MRQRFQRFTIFCVLPALFSGCSANFVLKPALPSTAVTSKRLPVKVYLRVDGNHIASPPLHAGPFWGKVSFEIGRTSVALFRQAMHAIFEEVTEDPQAADLVIVPAIKALESLGGRGSNARIVYEAEVTSQDRAFTAKIRGEGQKASNTSFFDSPSNIQDQHARIVEEAMQEAVLAIMDQMSRQLQVYASGFQKPADKTAVVRGAITAARPAAPEPATIPSDVDGPAFSPREKNLGDDDLAVVIGVERYQDLPAADYAAADARLVKEYLVALGLKERNIQLLVNEKATQSSIRKTIETWLANRVKKESRLIVYYSGHGSPDPATGKAYIVPHDGDPNYLADTGYPLDQLYAKLGELPAAETFVLLDSCFSGAGGRSVLAKGARPLVVAQTGAALPSKMVVLAATQGAQISTSAAEKGHGLFTYHFLKALRDGKKDVIEIYQHISPLVEDDAKALNVSQTPSLNPERRLVKTRFRLRN